MWKDIVQESYISVFKSLDKFDPVKGDLKDMVSLKKCLEELDADPRFYTTSIAMQDLDQVRSGLGYEQINLYGVSYGTRAALDYLRQFPDQTRSVILDGLAPPNWTLGPSTAGDAQRALDILFQRCTEQPECRSEFPNLSKN